MSAVNEKAVASAGLERSEKTIHKIWPTAVVAAGLGLTVAWTILLGYGLVKIIHAAI